MSGATILVADDDRAIRTVLTQALGRQGHVVRTTGNAATLWQWVKEGEGDLVITDVVMPDENAFDLIPRVKKLRPDLPIIVMSAQNTFMTAIRASEVGAYEYLPKPFDKAPDAVRVFFKQLPDEQLNPLAEAAEHLGCEVRTARSPRTRRSYTSSGTSVSLSR